MERQASMDGTVARARRGRPPAFDRNEALRRAMCLFWDRGYEGTSFDELLAVMGISASSFQNAFGSKQALYEAATALYLDEKAARMGESLAGGMDTRRAFEILMENTADAFTEGGGSPAGCMIALAGTHAAPACDPIRDMMVAQRALSERLMCERLQAGIDRGELPADTDPTLLAAFFGTVFRGMSVQARDGASREKLAEIGRLAMRAWPDLRHT